MTTPQPDGIPPRNDDWTWARARDFCADIEGPRREASLWALRVLEATLGPNWPEKASKLDGRPPTLLLEARTHSTVFAELMEWALSLHLLRDCEGMAKIRRNLTADARDQYRVHVAAQLEVARLTRFLGGATALETPLDEQTSPADITMKFGDTRVAAEVRVILQDDPWRAARFYEEGFRRRIELVEARHGVTCDVELLAELPPESEHDWFARLEDAAAAVALDHTTRHVRDWSARATVHASEHASGPHYRGPTRWGDSWRRVAARFQDKAAKHTSPTALWLRVDVFNGLWQFTQWAQETLATKLATIGPVIRSELAASPGIAGVVLSSGAAFGQGHHQAETVANTEAGVGLRRLIAPLRVRETFVVPLRSDAMASALAWCMLYDAEPRWLDWALQQINMPRLQVLTAP